MLRSAAVRRRFEVEVSLRLARLYTALIYTHAALENVGMLWLRNRDREAIPVTALSMTTCGVPLFFLEFSCRGWPHTVE